jgi:hypothetical protein
MMTEDYNDYAEPQKMGIIKALSILYPLLSLPSVDVETKSSLGWELGRTGSSLLRIGDFGCAGGSNSLFFMESVLQWYREHSPGTQIHGFLSDLPSNDYNLVFKTFQKSSLFAQEDFFLSCSSGSLYTRLFPSDSFQMQVSFASLHWLSQPVEVIAFQDPARLFYTVADPVADDLEIKILQSHSKRDLETFLECRLAELVSGGVLMFNCCGYSVDHPFPTASEEDETFQRCLAEMTEKKIRPDLISSNPLPTTHRIGKQLGLLLQETRKHFGVTSPGTAITKGSFVPAVHRSTQDVVDALTTNPVLFEGFKILHNSLCAEPEPTIWTKYIEGVYSDEQYVDKLAGYIRGWSESTIRGLLHNNEEAVTWFFTQMKVKIADEKEKWGMDNVYLTVCLQKL